MRVVVDTNLWISFLLGKSVVGLLRLIEDEGIEVHTDERQLAEIEDVLARSTFRKLIGSQRLSVMRRFLRRKTKIDKPHQRIKACRDPDDDFLLEIAVTSKASFLITGDADLLTLDPFRSIRIVTFREFKKLIEEVKP